MASYGDWEDKVFCDYVGGFAICEEKSAWVGGSLCRQLMVLYEFLADKCSSRASTIDQSSYIEGVAVRGEQGCLNK